MNVLFLDDNKQRTERFQKRFPFAKCVETAEECIAELSKNDFDVAFLDHDLGEEVFVSETEKNSGSEVVRWIMDNRPKIDKVVVHSMNASAAESMIGKLSSAGYDVSQVPFFCLFDKIKIIGEEA